eukprot:TRINITY_DN2903_c0_g1_i1.p1 TRINITY_DN2903_c0_g1~~TRINITY_DN2903_c0_g1_i1.p1  ORF type:complete len:382 (+),score=101.85 TRINITY_DN2903_c0_g1_i1:407-1552(+)
MATKNPFYLLGDDDAEDPSALLSKIAASKEKEKQAAPKKHQPSQKESGVAKLPSKPLPPAQAVRDSRSQNEGGRARGFGRGGRGGGRGFANRDQEYGRGRGGGAYNGDGNLSNQSYGRRVDFDENNVDYSATRTEDGEAVGNDRGRGRGGRGSRGGRGFGGRGRFGVEPGSEDSRKRIFERRSGTGRGIEMKREGSGRGNWGTPVDQEPFQEPEEAAVEDKTVADEKPANEVNQENPEEKKEEAEDKEMTLDEYEKIQEEKRKALLAMKAEERKVDTKEFESMQLLSKKKDDDVIFMKVGSEKDKGKKTDAGEKDEKNKKAITITEFLKPADGAGYYRGGRGRGRGRGERGRGSYSGGGVSDQPEAPKIEDHGQFPTLGGK